MGRTLWTSLPIPRPRSAHRHTTGLHLAEEGEHLISPQFLGVVAEVFWFEESPGQSSWLDGRHEQATTAPPPYHQLAGAEPRA